MVSCKEKEVIYNIGDEVTIDGIKYKLYSTNELGYNRENKHAGYFNPDGTLKNINEEDIYKKNDDRVGYLHKFYYYDMLNLDKYPDLTVDLIQNEYRNKNIHCDDSDTAYYDERNLVQLYPSQLFYIDENGLPQNDHFFFSTSNFYDFICREDAYWVVIGYDYDDIKEDTLILHRIGDYTIIAIAYKALEGAPMKTLTVEAPTDEEIKDKDDIYPDSYGQAYIPVLYYPYAISNCPNLISITTFNGYFMPLSISNIPNRIELNFASKSDYDLGMFALDAAFYNLKIKNLTLNFLNQTTILGAGISGINGDRIYAKCGLAGCYNLIFTNCYVSKLNNVIHPLTTGIGSTLFLDLDRIVALPCLSIEKHIIGIIPSKTVVSSTNVVTATNVVIEYQISGQVLPRIKDGVCYQAYNDYMLEEYKDESKIVIFPEIYYESYASKAWRLNGFHYFTENGYVKLKLTGEFLTLRKCNHTNKYDIYCLSREIKVETDVVLTLCKIDDNSTYLVADGTVLHSKN